jgi:uncharacterized cupin superfamily protein
MNPPNIQHLSQVPITTQVSPGQTFMALRRNLSEALGSPRDDGIWNGGHPFDVEQVEVPAGHANFPYHAHAAMWEFYWILKGAGTLRLESGQHPLKAGDFFICPPNEAHQLIASADQSLEYVVISDNVMADLVHYPDSGKWNAKPGRRIFREQLDYYDGEEA